MTLQEKINYALKGKPDYNSSTWVTLETIGASVALAKELGVPKEVFQKILKDVYGSKPEEINQILGQLSIFLFVLAEHNGASLQECTIDELQRVCAKPAKSVAERQLDIALKGLDELVDKNPMYAIFARRILCDISKEGKFDV